MEGLFGHEAKLYPFHLFSREHLLVIFLFVLISVLLYLFRKRLRPFEKTFRVILFTVLFTFESLYHYWLFQAGQWDISFTLPLQLCSISLLLCLILLVTDSKLMFQIVYFLGIAGATQALITPELFFGFPHFRYFQFFITHMLIIWVSFFYMFVKGFQVTKKGMWQALIFLNLAAIIAFLANLVTKGNYMFLAHKPTNPSLLDYLGPYPYYILVLEAIAFALFYLLYLPWKKKG